MLQTLAMAGPFSLPNPAAMQPGRVVAVEADMYAANDIAPLSELDGEWYRYVNCCRGTNQAWLDARVEVQAGLGNWRLGLLHREQAMAHANDRTVEIARDIEMDVPGALAQQADIDYRSAYFAANGVRLAFADQLPWGNGWRWGVGFSLLHGTRLRLDAGHGTAKDAGNNQIRFDGYRVTTDSHFRIGDPTRFNPYVPNEQVDGGGYSSDAGVSWQENGSYLGLSVTDMLGRMAWHQVPNSYQAGSILYDQDGNFIGAADGSAAITGYDSRETVHFDLPRKWLAEYRQRLGNWQLGASYGYVDGLRLPGLLAGYMFNETSGIQLAYDQRFDSWRIGARWHAIAASLQTDNRDFAKARAVGASLVLSVPF